MIATERGGGSTVGEQRARYCTVSHRVAKGRCHPVRRSSRGRTSVRRREPPAGRVIKVSRPNQPNAELDTNGAQAFSSVVREHSGATNQPRFHGR